MRPLGDINGVIHAAGVSPAQAAPETILKVDLYGTTLVLEEFGLVVAQKLSPAEEELVIGPTVLL